MIGMPVTAFISGIGGGELIVIFLIFLVLFGAKKMPGIARSLGKSVSEFQRAAREVREEFLNADRELNKPSTTPSATPALPETSPDAATDGVGDHPDSAEYYGSPEIGGGESGGPIEPVREAAATPEAAAPEAAASDAAVPDAASPVAEAPPADAPATPAQDVAAAPADSSPTETTPGHVDEAPKA